VGLFVAGFLFARGRTVGALNEYVDASWSHLNAQKDRIKACDALDFPTAGGYHPPHRRAVPGRYQALVAKR
jgi:hypothetical protein